MFTEHPSPYIAQNKTSEHQRNCVNPDYYRIWAAYLISLPLLS